MNTSGLSAFAAAAAAAICIAAAWVAAPVHAAGVHPTPQEIAACGGDAQRLCAPEIQSGRVLACLQVHRAALSKSCAALLMERGL
jgi:hypothetical protein